MVTALLRLPGGREASTVAEVAFIRALQCHARARSDLGKASERRKEAQQHLLKLLSERGPCAVDVEPALVAWRDACAEAYTAAARVTNLDRAVEHAVRAWARENAATYQHRDAARG